MYNVYLYPVFIFSVVFLAMVHNRGNEQSDSLIRELDDKILA
jgi:hypothetical protein